MLESPLPVNLELYERFPVPRKKNSVIPRMKLFIIEFSYNLVFLHGLPNEDVREAELALDPRCSTAGH